MTILIKLGLTLVGIFGIIFLSIVAVASLLSGYYSWRDRSIDCFADVIIGTCWFIMFASMSIACAALTIGSYL